jgi:hypothetical protein
MLQLGASQGKSADWLSSFVTKAARLLPDGPFNKAGEPGDLAVD